MTSTYLVKLEGPQPLKLPPCPSCGKRIEVKVVRHYPNGIERRIQVRWPIVLERLYEHQKHNEHWKEADWLAKFRAWQEAARDLWKAARPKRLSYEEIHQRQVLAGKRQLKRDKARGGYNASAQDKGGRIATHNRWHVKRGIKKPGCELCESAA